MRASRKSIRDFIALAVAHDGAECLIWPFARTGVGYATSRGGLTHNKICKRRNANPKNFPCALHSCGNGHLGCVSGAHLYWGTQLDNAADRDLHGRTARGEKSPRAILTEAEAQSVLDSSETGLEAAERLGVSRSAIYNIRGGWSWAHLRRRRSGGVA